MDLYNSKTYLEDLESAIKASVGIEELKNKSVLVTGATGTIGSFVVDMLLYYNQKYKANIMIYASGRNLDRLQVKFKGIKTNQLVLIEYDILKPINFDFQVDYIIHAAGNAHPAGFNSDPVGTIMGNVNGTYMLLEYGKKHGIKRFLYISSGEIYGQGNIAIFDELYSGYVNPLALRSSYPSSKRTAETLCVAYSKQFSLDIVIVRPCHTYGPCFTDSDNRANVQFIRNILNDENVVLNSAGNQFRSYCYVTDCASAIITVLIKGENRQAYNIANPNSQTTIARLAQIIARIAEKKVIFSDADIRELDNQTPIERQILDSKKIEALGWIGQYSLERGIFNTIAILRGN